MATLNEDLCDDFCRVVMNGEKGHEPNCPVWQDWLDRQSLEDLRAEEE